MPLTGKYGWRWQKVKRLLKVVAPATAAMLSVGLQGAGLAHLPGASLTCHSNLLVAMSVSSAQLPCALEYCASDLLLTACPFCAASVSQMLTGSVIIFAAILSRVILKRRLNRWHYGGCV